ncbi:hypothetical protein [Tumebacillus flagellatus]|nr:hypothetical protein [Tumebacillus flagellatus]
MKLKFLVGLLVAVACIAIGSSSIQQTAEISPPGPFVIVNYK